MKEQVGKYLRVILGVLLLGQVWVAAAEAKLNLAPVKEVDLARNFTYQPLPKWENGFFLGFELQPVSAPPVFAYDHRGRLVFETGLPLPDATRVEPLSVAASPQGVFAVSGTAASGAGAGVAFIAWLDQNGHVTKLLRLTEYAPVRICFTEDGTLWAAGRAIVPPNALQYSDHDVIRGYSPAGELKYSLLPLSRFGELSTRHPAKKCHLVSNGREVLFLSEEFNQLARISLDGRVLMLREIPKPRPNMYMITGVVLTPESEIYVSGQVRLGKSKQAVSLLRWNPSPGFWSEIYLTDTNPFAVFGFDQGKLIIAGNPSRFRWVEYRQGGAN